MKHKPKTQENVSRTAVRKAEAAQCQTASFE